MQDKLFSVDLLQNWSFFRINLSQLVRWLFCFSVDRVFAHSKRLTDAYMCCSKGKSALHWAEENQHKNVVLLLSKFFCATFHFSICINCLRSMFCKLATTITCLIRRGKGHQAVKFRAHQSFGAPVFFTQSWPFGLFYKDFELFLNVKFCQNLTVFAFILI